MKERPIIFNGEMVKAILDNRKKQTRRIVKPQPGWNERIEDLDVNNEYPGCCFAVIGNSMSEIKCPYGQPGDRLWVREKFSLYKITTSDNCIQELPIYFESYEAKKAIKWKPSIHMPRWAIRITLEITSVRVERLQDIDNAGAIAEGLFIKDPTGGANDCGLTHKFKNLWNQINGSDAWDKNPWVWVIEFRRV